MTGQKEYKGVWWTTERVDLVRQLYKEGRSNSIIANLMGTTRNAVSGVANRLGIKKKEPVKAEKKSRVRKPLTEEQKALRRKPKVIAEIIKDGNDIPPLLDSIAELTADLCSYPYGDQEFKFCGRPKVHGAYCSAHGHLCYTAPKARSDVRPFYFRAR